MHRSTMVLSALFGRRRDPASSEARLGGGSRRDDRWPERVLGPLLCALAVVFLALRFLAIRTESGNWDEFAVFQRTANMIRTGILQGAGRPGAIELVLAPFVRGCRTSLEAIQEARYLWLGVTILLLGGLFELVRRACLDYPRPGHAAGLSVALYALVPPFLRWSIQVRTDQMAVACGLWAGVLLLASTAKANRAVWAGLLLGVGYQFSQKVAYVGLLVGITFLVQWCRQNDGLERELWRGLILRGALGLAGVGTAFFIYHAIVGSLVGLPKPLDVQLQLDDFDYYRRVFGVRLYVGLLPKLGPHLLLFALLIAVSIRRRFDSVGRTHLLLAWSIFGGALLVGWFHASALPWFYMTIGLFPAVALGTTLGPILRIVPPHSRSWILLLIVTALTAGALPYAVSLLEDTAIGQRGALEFIERNFPRDAAGFQSEGALLCRPDPQPFPVLHRVVMRRVFSPERAAASVLELRSAFESKPVHFLIWIRALRDVPPELSKFWQENYHQYWESVWIAGARLEGHAGTAVDIELLVPGRYRFLPGNASTSARIRVFGQQMGGGDTIQLAKGELRVELIDDLEAGHLLLAMSDPPKPRDHPWYPQVLPDEVNGLW